MKKRQKQTLPILELAFAVFLLSCLTHSAAVGSDGIPSGATENNSPGNTPVVFPGTSEEETASTEESVDQTSDEQSSEESSSETDSGDTDSSVSTDESEFIGIVDFNRDIASIFRNRCQSCHQGDNPKGGFLALDRDTVLAYVSSGDAAASSLWTDYLNQPHKSIDEDSLVMPPDGPLSVNELALIKLWIDEGAQWPESESLETDSSNGSVESVSTSATLVPANISRKGFKAFGYLHPALVHFPVALILVSGVCAFFSYFLGDRCQAFAFHLLWIGALFCIASSAAGWSFAETRGYTEWKQFPPIESTPEIKAAFVHRWLGVIATIISLVTVVTALFAYQTKSRSLTHAWRLTTILLAILVSYVGHKGGELVYGDVLLKIKEILAS